MRLGLLGPAEGDVDALARAAENLVDRIGVDRVKVVKSLRGILNTRLSLGA